MQQLFADLPEAITNTLELSNRLEFTLNDLGYEFPRYPVPEGETMNSFLREQAWDRFPPSLRPHLARHASPRPPPDRKRTEAHRKTQARRILPHRLGPGPLLPRAKHSRAGTRIGRQQRRLLLARHHRRRRRRHGTSLRAFSFRRTRRVARHRSRSAQRRRARKSHPVCLQHATASAAPP